MLSQILFYRRGSGLPYQQLGSLYWQLYDVWVGPTWASIEHSLRQKVVYYAAKDLYNPMTIHAFHDIDKNSLEIRVVSDLWDIATGEATIKWMDSDGNPLNTSPPSANKVSLDGQVFSQATPPRRMQSSTCRLLQGSSHI